MASAGHAPNALAQRATANVNCRILPGEDPQAVQQTLSRAIGNSRISVTPVAAAKPSPPSPLTPEIMQTITRITEEMWPGVPVIPFMSTGATDGLYFREAGIPIYGVSGLFGDMDDVRAHGRPAHARERRLERLVVGAAPVHAERERHRQAKSESLLHVVVPPSVDAACARRRSRSRSESDGPRPGSLHGHTSMQIAQP